jgi:mannose-1-phosphate guanylyltransferase
MDPGAAMKAVVLAAGRGTRLGELTADRPKPALPVGGHPIIAHVVAQLVRCGFDKIAVNVHYEPDQVRAALADAEARITWFEEPELLGTAGALAPMREFLEGERAFLLHYGDVLTDHDLRGMLTRHNNRRALLTMLVHERRGSNSVVVLDEASRIVEFLERPSGDERRRIASPWVNSGVYAFDVALLELISSGPSDIAADIVPRVLASGAAFGEPLKGFRCAVDSAERLVEAERALETGRWSSPLGNERVKG